MPSLPIARNSSLYLRQLEVGPMQNFIYLIGDKEKRECVMIDPAWDVDAVLKVAEADGMKVTAGIATHYHYDHTNGIADLITRLNIPVYANKNDIAYINKEVKGEVKAVDAGHKIQIGGIEITCIHTPGHTPGSQCFHVLEKGGKEESLVSGDTLFINACGRCDLPGGNAEQMYQSLATLAKLPDEMILLPGHNYDDHDTQSTIGKEKKFNPYLQAHTLKDFLTERMG